MSCAYIVIKSLSILIVNGLIMWDTVAIFEGGDPLSARGIMKCLGLFALLYISCIITIV